jgi:hypothetical protein
MHVPTSAEGWIDQIAECFGDPGWSRRTDRTLRGHRERQPAVYLTSVEHRPQLGHPINPFVLFPDEHNFVRRGRPCQSSNMNISTLGQRPALSIEPMSIMRSDRRTSEMRAVYGIHRHGPGPSPSPSASQCGYSLDGLSLNIHEIDQRPKPSIGFPWRATRADAISHRRTDVRFEE